MQYKSLFVLGRQPAIGAAELESLLGADHIYPVGNVAVLSDISPSEINFARIGSATRMAKTITQFDTTNWTTIARNLEKALPEQLDYLPAEGKLKLGLSVFDLHATTQQLFRTGLQLKNICKRAGR